MEGEKEKREKGAEMRKVERNFQQRNRVKGRQHSGSMGRAERKTEGDIKRDKDEGGIKIKRRRDGKEDGMVG